MNTTTNIMILNTGSQNGFRPLALRSELYRYVESVSIPVEAPLLSWVMIKSSREMVNAIAKPLITPGSMVGMITLKSALMGLAPRSSAAS